MMRDWASVRSFETREMVTADMDHRGRILELECAVQNYDWGIIGDDSLAGTIHQLNSGKPISEDKPYAELWMGTHPNGPSFVKMADGSRVELRSVLGKDLPFLFKILSVRKALSIQAHPDAKLARELHAKYPDTYKDPNHKPEIAIALTNFEALCGFTPVQQIVDFAAKYPELASLVSETSLQALEASVQSKDEEVKKGALKAFFADLMNADPELVKTKTKHLLTRFAKPDSLEALFLRLQKDYPAEVGCFCIFLMNYVTLQPGECVFLAANEPHAYLAGECVECMALSDNVVRAGLTPKFRDVETLCSMLTYSTYEGAEVFTKSKAISKFSQLYEAPVEEFSVLKTKFDMTGQSETVLRSTETLLLCLSGEVFIHSSKEARKLSRGLILVLPANEELVLTCMSSGCLLFQAYQPAAI